LLSTDENLLSSADPSIHSSPGESWSLDRLKWEIIGFNSDIRVVKLRENFRNSRRKLKELKDYAVCFVEYQYQIECLLKEVTDKVWFEEALNTYSSDLSLSSCLESVRDAPSRLSKD